MNRILPAFCLLLAIALPCHAQGDKPKPNTLTPKEIADGWILLFDGETMFGWASEGKARAANGAIEMLGSAAKVTHITAWQSVDLRFECQTKPAANGDPNPLLGHAGFWLKGTSQSVGIERDKRDWYQCRCLLETDGKSRTYSLGIWVAGAMNVDAKNVGSDGQVFGGVHPQFFGSPIGSGVSIRNVKLKPLNTKSIFDGKDLAGWKEFPGKKSTFAVADGAINVKDGPGDLQSVGKYRDFVLQLECKSNGKHLNSGIFFRCRDNEYQNGYEAQIRNQFTEKPTQKYLIEEYDPKTNKLIGKKEQFFTAVDYGTGAIYRRQPARKEMAKDGEWFGMTIVAHGNHLATWVNGVQVTDFTDNRPKSDNARTGCKLEAGHISIQGHDPTTDLSFRNLRIAEFK